MVENPVKLGKNPVKLSKMNGMLETDEQGTDSEDEDDEDEEEEQVDEDSELTDDEPTEEGRSVSEEQLVDQVRPSSSPLGQRDRVNADVVRRPRQVLEQLQLPAVLEPEIHDIEEEDEDDEEEQQRVYAVEPIQVNLFTVVDGRRNEVKPSKTQ